MNKTVAGRRVKQSKEYFFVFRKRNFTEDDADTKFREHEAKADYLKVLSYSEYLINYDLNL